ncbi:MAG: hypothetical protein JXQ71_08235 [Verrucomicrobia bacterium]|nr:hypothetical protein [Verrucomicrobiota bacterium]
MTIIRDALQRLNTDPTALRRFGLLMGAVAIGFGAACLKPHPQAAPWLLGAGSLLAAAGALKPGALKPVYRVWMGLAVVLGLAMSTALLTLLFYLVVTPLGLVARACGRDFLQRKRQADAASFWLMRDPGHPTPPEHYKRQY